MQNLVLHCNLLKQSLNLGEKCCKKIGIFIKQSLRSFPLNSYILYTQKQLYVYIHVSVRKFNTQWSRLFQDPKLISIKNSLCGDLKCFVSFIVIRYQENNRKLSYIHLITESHNCSCPNFD